MVPRLTAPAGPRPEVRCHQLGHSATRTRDSAILSISGGCLRAALHRARTPTRACVRHRPAVLLVLVAFAAMAILLVSNASGSNVNVRSEGAAPAAGTLADPLAVGTMTTRQPEPEPVPTARIRYDIPGWDSIRRTPVVRDVSAVESVYRTTVVSTSPESLLIPFVLGVLAPVLGWVGLSLVIRCDQRRIGAPASGTEGRHALLLSGLREMTAERARVHSDHTVSARLSHGGNVDGSGRRRHGDH
jgi:hypothetical protein